MEMNDEKWGTSMTLPEIVIRCNLCGDIMEPDSVYVTNGVVEIFVDQCECDDHGLVV